MIQACFRLSQNSRNVLNRSFLLFTTAFISTYLARSQSLGEYLLLTYSLQYITPGLGPEVLNVGKHLKPIQLSNFCVNKCAQKSTPRAFLISLLLAVYGSGLGLDGPGEPEEPNTNPFYMLNIFGFNNFPQKSSPVVVLALGLLLAVYGPRPGPDGPGGLKVP